MWYIPQIGTDGRERIVLGLVRIVTGTVVVPEVPVLVSNDYLRQFLGDVTSIAAPTYSDIRTSEPDYEHLTSIRQFLGDI